MHSLNYPTRVAGVALALGLLASACGSEVAPSVDASTDSGGNTAQSGSDEDQGAAPAEADEQTEGSESAVQEESTDNGEEAAAPADHLFPDLNTVNIMDGSTVNLADELAGGDTPILLWFWAPH